MPGIGDAMPDQFSRKSSACAMIASTLVSLRMSS
jgi:hypothetical protein